MKNLYLIGKNISHSLSPIIHNKAFEIFNINAKYMIKDIDDEQKVQNLIREQNFFGINITTPYKKLLLNENIIISDKVKLAESMNTLFFRDGKLHAETTDGIGFYKSLDEKISSICIVGLGSSAKSIVEELVNHHYKINIITSNTINAENWTKKLNTDKIDICSIYNKNECKKLISTVDVLVDATGLSRFGKFIIDPEFIKKGQICIDLNYGKGFTSVFLQEAKKQGANICYGDKMLVYQAAEAFFMWFGKKFDEEKMYKFLQNEI